MTDGHGLVFDIAIDIWVAPVPIPVDPRPLPPPPLATPPPPWVEPGMTGEPIRALVERTLGTRAVKRVHSAGRAEVWARSKLSRRDLMRDGGGPGMVVVCSARCRIKADAELATGARAIRSSRRKSVVSMTPGQPHVLSLALGPPERRALSRARKSRAQFRLSIRAGGAKASSLKRAIPIGR